MSRPEFNRYSDSYSELLKDPIRDRFTGANSDFFQVRKSYLILDYFRRKQRETATMRYLDVGCGKGDLLRLLQPSFASVAGCDPSGRMISSINGIDIRLQEEDNKLPFPAEQFDFVTASAVFHHVAPAERVGLAKEVQRVMKPGGVFAIIEHNPLNPVTRLIVSRSPVDAGAILLRASQARTLFISAKLRVDEQSYFLYLPAQFYENAGRWFETLLAKIPFGGQYAVFGVKSS